MVQKIEKDHQRFRQIVKGKIRGDLRKFLTRGELIGKEGKNLISIPIKGIDLPHFKLGLITCFSIIILHAIDKTYFTPID